MIIVDNAELAATLAPWGITFPSYGRLELSETEFMGAVTIALWDGVIGVCWGGPSAEELIFYGNVQGLFDLIYNLHADTVEASNLVSPGVG